MIFRKIGRLSGVIVLILAVILPLGAAYGTGGQAPIKPKVVVDEAELRAVAKAVLGLDAASVSGRKLIYPKGVFFELEVRTSPLEVRASTFEGRIVACERHVISFGATEGKTGYVPSVSTHRLEYALPKGGCAGDLDWINFGKWPVSPSIAAEAMIAANQILLNLDSKDFCERYVAPEAGDCGHVTQFLKKEMDHPVVGLGLTGEFFEKEADLTWSATFGGKGLVVYRFSFRIDKDGPKIVEVKRTEIHI